MNITSTVDLTQASEILQPQTALRGSGKPVEFLRFEGLDHQLDDSAARRQLLEKIGALLDRTIGH